MFKAVTKWNKSSKKKKSANEKDDEVDSNFNIDVSEYDIDFISSDMSGPDPCNHTSDEPVDADTLLQLQTLLIDEEGSKCDEEGSKCDEEGSKCDEEERKCDEEGSKCDDEERTCDDEEDKEESDRINDMDMSAVALISHSDTQIFPTEIADPSDSPHNHTLDISDTGDNTTAEDKTTHETSDTVLKRDAEVTPNCEKRQQSHDVAPVNNHESPAIEIQSTVDEFTPVENAVREAMKEAFLEAKANHQSNREMAAKLFKKYKHLKDELIAIESRRKVPGAKPPLFHWKVTTQESTFEDRTLGDDQIRVVIESVNDLENVLRDHSSRKIGISYSLEIVSESVSVPAVKYIDNDRSACFRHTRVFSFHRNKTSERKFNRKSASFDLTLHRGFFKSDKPLGLVKVPLVELLTKCQTGGDISITNSSGRKSVGGTLRVFISLRRPLCTAEIRKQTQRELMIEYVPESQSTIISSQSYCAGDSSSMFDPILSSNSENALETAPMTQQQSKTQTLEPTLSGNSENTPETVPITQQQSKTQTLEPTLSGKSENTPETVPITQQQSKTQTLEPTLSGKSENTPETVPITQQQSQTVTAPAEELSDPLNVKLLVSNDVLTNEIKRAQDSRRSALNDDDRQKLDLRIMLLKSSLLILENKVLNEQLSMESYLQVVRERLQKDKVLAVACMQQGRKREALEVMKRIRIMQEELDGVANCTDADS